MKLTERIILQIEDPLKSFKALQRIIAFICIFIPLILRSCDKDEFNPVYVQNTILNQLSICRDSIKVDTFTKVYCIGRETQLIMKSCRSKDVSTIMTATIIKKYCWGFRSSISSYAYSSNSYLYGMLYCMAAMLFIYNGVTHIKIFKNKDRFLFTNLNTRSSWCYIIIGISLILVILNPVHDREILHYIFAVLFFGLNIYAIAFLPNSDVSKKDKIKRYIIAVAAAMVLIISIYKDAILWGEWASLFIISIHLVLVSNSVQLQLKSS